MPRRSLIGSCLIASMAAALLSSAAQAAVIDNDIAVGTLGHFDVDVTPGGETTTGHVTGLGAVSGLTTPEIIFEYNSYIDTGSGGVKLGSTTGATGSLTGDDEYTSSGSFTGSNGNEIGWEVVSSIADGAADMINAVTFTAMTGTLGTLQFSQYLDEDVLGFGDDVFFTRGTAGGGDLKLYTVDDAEEIGISHGGAYSAAQGLAGAIFNGFAANEYDELQTDIEAGSAIYSPTGFINTTNLPPYLHPTFGAAYGPRDITSALAWTVDPDATTATIYTSLGGVPTADSVSSVPEPTSMVLLGLTAVGGMGLGYRRRRNLQPTPKTHLA